MLSRWRCLIIPISKDHGGSLQASLLYPVEYRTTRHAYFQYTVPDIAWDKADKPHLKITGLDHLQSIRLHHDFSEEEWEKAKASVPIHVTPMVALKHPMELVCTAGIPVTAGDNDLPAALDSLRELAPLAAVLGFNAIESYLTWNRIEPEEGKFDFSFYDTIAEKLRQYGLKMVPLAHHRLSLFFTGLVCPE